MSSKALVAPTPLYRNCRAEYGTGSTLMRTGQTKHPQRQGDNPGGRIA
jgi:hypothetical protein